MRVLHVVKTSDGAWWAANQAAELVRRGVEVHVALPSAKGLALPYWVGAAAQIHVVDLDFPAKAPWKLPSVCRAARQLVAALQPDVIHSHFFGTTMVLRRALRGQFAGPIVFQVAGPLHLEHGLYRTWDIRSARPNDYWIASSPCIVKRYLNAGVPHCRLFLSYYGENLPSTVSERCGVLRNRLGITANQLVVGNISWMYAPKYYLGQRVGVKCHEDLIDGLGIVTSQRADVTGVLVGGQWGGGKKYERSLCARAKKRGSKILLTGFMPKQDVHRAWADFDCGVHVPLSENCGGVVEPLAAGVPTIAGRVGGLPEVVMDGISGKTVGIRDPMELASTIIEVLHDLGRYRKLAITGQQLVRTMFDVRRTAAEVFQVYHHILDPSVLRPTDFDSARCAEAIANGRPACA